MVPSLMVCVGACLFVWVVFLVWCVRILNHEVSHVLFKKKKNMMDLNRVWTQLNVDSSLFYQKFDHACSSYVLCQIFQTNSWQICAIFRLLRIRISANLCSFYQFSDMRFENVLNLNHQLSSRTRMHISGVWEFLFSADILIF